MSSSRRGPGLAKVRKHQVANLTRRELVAVRDGWWSAMVERADVISEGAVENGTYFGTTSLRFAIEQERVGADRAADDPGKLARLILADPHARLRVLRLAHREATTRADASLDVMEAEIVARLIEDGEGTLLSIDVDVSAPVVRGQDDTDAHRDAM